MKMMFPRISHLICEVKPNINQLNSVDYPAPCTILYIACSVTSVSTYCSTPQADFLWNVV